MGTEALGKTVEKFLRQASYPQDLTKQTKYGLQTLIKYQINDTR